MSFFVGPSASFRRGATFRRPSTARFIFLSVTKILGNVSVMMIRKSCASRRDARLRFVEQNQRGGHCLWDVYVSRTGVHDKIVWLVKVALLYIGVCHHAHRHSGTAAQRHSNSMCTRSQKNSGCRVNSSTRRPSEIQTRPRRSPKHRAGSGRVTRAMRRSP
jgi:hypothetical protein